MVYERHADTYIDIQMKHPLHPNVTSESSEESLICLRCDPFNRVGLDRIPATDQVGERRVLYLLEKGDGVLGVFSLAFLRRPQAFFDDRRRRLRGVLQADLGNFGDRHCSVKLGLRSRGYLFLKIKER